MTIETNMRRMMTGALLLMVATLGARAEEDFVELNDTSKVVDLDEVVVVSQPKEATLLRLQPVSSNLFGASEMQRLQVRDLRELSAYVPSFSMPQYG
mgnify:CR=1 FL=1